MLRRQANARAGKSQNQKWNLSAMDLAVAISCEHCGQRHELILENASRIEVGKDRVQYQSARIIDPCAAWKQKLAGDPNVQIITRQGN